MACTFSPLTPAPVVQAPHDCTSGCSAFGCISEARLQRLIPCRRLVAAFWSLSPKRHSAVPCTKFFSFQFSFFFRASRPPGIPLQCTSCQSNTAIFLFILRYHMICPDAASIFNRISKIPWWGGATLWFGYPLVWSPVQGAEGHWCGRAGGVRPSGRARGARALKLAGRLPARRSVAKIRSPNFPILNRVRVGH